jgi:cytidylate kinase
MISWVHILTGFEEVPMKPAQSGAPYERAHQIERQMLLRNARDRVGREGTLESSPFRYRVITISRDCGSLGTPIAQQLAKRIGWHVFDREIVNYVAENSHVRQTLVDSLDEHSKNLVHDAVERFLGMSARGSFGVEEYHEALLKTLSFLAVRGEAVVVGRGANFALRHEPDGLHVRIVGSAEVRSRRLAERWQVSVEEAARRMREIDADRRSFVRHHFRHDIDDPAGYDLIFNTDHLTQEQVTASIHAVLETQA